MTISDCIAQLTRLMSQVGSSAQVRLCRQYNSIENPFDSFEIRKPIGSKEVFLVPSNVWIRHDLKGLAERENLR